MRNLKIRFFIYRMGLVEKKIHVTESKYFEIKFLLEKEFLRIKNRLQEFKSKEIIRTTSKNARILNSKYREETTGLMFSRQTIDQALTIMKRFR